MNTQTVEFFFDVSSPWTYLAFHNVLLMAEEAKATVIWKPILVDGVFNSVNPSVYASRDNPVPAKRDYLLKDLQDWARAAGLTINFPPSVRLSALKPCAPVWWRSSAACWCRWHARCLRPIGGAMKISRKTRCW